MLLIRCPWCGLREENEFRYGGQAHVRDPGPDVDDGRWAQFLFYRDNPVGPFAERWAHTQGCRRWFHLVRDTTNHDITGSYLLDQRPEDAR